MYSNIPNEIKLFIFSFLPHKKSFDILITNYHLYYIFMSKYYPIKYSEKMINGYYNNFKKNCFYCYKKLKKSYIINLCYECNVLYENNRNYIKICDNCINLEKPLTYTPFKVYTNKNKLISNVFKDFNCKNCTHKTMHLLITDKS